MKGNHNPNKRWTARFIIKCAKRPVEVVFAPANIRSNQVLEHAHTQRAGRNRIGEGLDLCDGQVLKMTIKGKPNDYKLGFWEERDLVWWGTTMAIISMAIIAAGMLMAIWVR